MTKRLLIGVALLGLLMWAIDTGVSLVSGGDFPTASLASAQDGQPGAGAGQRGPDGQRPNFGRGRGFGRGGPGQGMPPGGPGRGGPGASQATTFERDPVPKDTEEEKILAVLDDISQNQRQGTMIVPTEDGRLLRLLAESIGAKNVVEIGTSVGHSGIWICLALRKTGGKLTTYEIDAGRAALARENFKRAGVDKLVTLVEGDAHEEVTKLTEPVDMIFLDADKEGYIDYLNKLVPLVRPGGLITAHNMNTRQADARYVEAITGNPDLETLFLHMDGAGVGVTMKKR